MRASVVSLLLISLLGAPVLGVPSSGNQLGARKGGAADPPVTTVPGNGIPTVGNSQTAACRPFYAVRDAIMGDLYHGRCNDLARAAVRAAFHDAGPFSLALQAQNAPNGAADGSLLTDADEVLRPENNGLGKIIAALMPLPARYGVSPGDVLHLAGNLGVIACPGGPTITTYVGRGLPLNRAPDGRLPNPNSPVSVLLARFADMGFTTRELMALIGAHSTGKQRFQGASSVNTTFDSTVDVWDVRFYSETQSAATPGGVTKLASDVNFSRDPSTVKDYNRFVGKQNDWGEDYALAHEKMSLLGLNRGTLVDCTEIMPQPIDLKSVQVKTSGGNKPLDPAIDPALLEAAIQQFRSIWL